MRVRKLTDKDKRREAVPILRQLWKHKTPEEVFEWTGNDDYHLFGGFQGSGGGDGDRDGDDELIAVAGVLESHLLHHTRHAWLYDLVVDESERGNGYGASMVEYVEEWAEDRGCDYVALASPVDKEDAHQFYEAQDYQRWGHVIQKSI